MITPLELVKRTPKSNCGQCGHPTCLAFAALVVTGAENPRRCPCIDLSGLDLPPASAASAGQLPPEQELKLINHLKQKVAPLDFATLAEPLGASWQPSKPDTLCFDYLGQPVRLQKNGLLLDGNASEDPRDQILLYNYVHSGGGTTPNGDWVGLESLPNSISKVRTLALYCEERLAEHFGRHPRSRLVAACKALHGILQPDTPASLGCIIPVLPRVPQYLLYWEAEPDEGFAAKVKILFDRRVLDYLDLESLVFSAERMADSLTAVSQQ